MLEQYLTPANNHIEDMKPRTYLYENWLSKYSKFLSVQLSAHGGSLPNNEIINDKLNAACRSLE